MAKARLVAAQNQTGTDIPIWSLSSCRCCILLGVYLQQGAGARDIPTVFRAAEDQLGPSQLPEVRQPPKKASKSELSRKIITAR